MSTNFEPIIGQVSLVGGQTQRVASNLATIALPAGRGRERGLLAILVDMGGPVEGRDAQAEKLVEAAQAGYLEASASLTLSLRRAVEAANQVLFNSNQNVPLESRRRAGIACVMVQGEDAYIAHAGPALVCVAQGGVLRRYPAAASMTDEVMGIPLGVHTELEVNLFHVRLAPGDTLLLASADLSRMSPGDVLGTILTEDAANIPEVLATLPGSDNLSVLAISLPGEGSGQRSRGAEVLSGAKEQEQGSRRAEVLSGAKEQEQRSRSPERSEGTGAREQSVAALPASLPARPHDFIYDQEDAEAEDEELEWVEVEPVPSLLHRVWPGGVRSFLDSLVVMARAGSRSVARGLRRGIRVLVLLLQRTLPDREERLDLGGQRQRSQVLGGLALVFPLLVGVLTLVMYFQNQSRFEALLAQARDRQAALLSAGANRPKMLEALREAEVIITQALVLRPSDPAALQMQAQIQAQLDQVAGIVWLDGLRPLVQLPGGSRPRRVWIFADTVYMLDPGARQAYRYPLGQVSGSQAPGAEVLLRGGQIPGGGDPIDLVGLTVLDNPVPIAVGILSSSGTLLRYQATGIPAVWPVVASDTWKSPIAATSFDGNLYILDSGRDQIYKYVGSDEGYTVAPAQWLQAQVNLNRAVDMAIDGTIYVLFSDGSIQKFIGGKPEPFEVIALDEPLRNPTAIFTTPSSKSLYIADTGNQRIVQVGKDRLFQRQLRPPRRSNAFAGLQGLFVDEARGFVYALSENVLYAAQVPALKSP